MEKYKKYLDKRIVLTCNNNVSYAGVAKKLLNLDQAISIIVELDNETGFSILCPINFIKNITIIPIPNQTD